MLNLFKRETEESMIKLIAAQSDLIALYKDSSKSRDEIISNLRRLVNLQEEQIEDLKSDLKIMRQRLASYSESIAHYKDQLSELRKKQ